MLRTHPSVIYELENLSKAVQLCLLLFNVDFVIQIENLKLCIKRPLSSRLFYPVPNRQTIYLRLYFIVIFFILTSTKIDKLTSFIVHNFSYKFCVIRSETCQKYLMALLHLIVLRHLSSLTVTTSVHWLYLNRIGFIIHARCLDSLVFLHSTSANTVISISKFQMLLIFVAYIEVIRIVTVLPMRYWSFSYLEVSTDLVWESFVYGFFVLFQERLLTSSYLLVLHALEMGVCLNYGVVSSVMILII